MAPTTYNLPSVTAQEYEAARQCWDEFGFTGDDLTPMLKLLRHFREVEVASVNEAYEAARGAIDDCVEVVTPCADCSVDVSLDEGIAEMFMVHDHVWATAGLAPDDGCLCVECIEFRLGRQLNGEDFMDLPMNTLPDYPRSERLAERLRTSGDR